MDLQDLANKLAALEYELQDTREECEHATCQAQARAEEKLELLDIIQKLCLEIQEPLHLDI